jgi:serine/threonine protein kinase/tetratricopeptide (TPR) repeat protein
LNPDQDRTQAISILAPGAAIAQYRILEPLGVGGMGEVFLAEDTRLKRRVALKFLAPQFAADEALRGRFMREAQSAAALNHPNVVTIYEVAQHETRVFIAMEYVRGQTLRDLIDSGTLTLERSLRIILQVCEGLSAAHAANMVHRDIKPLNILVDPTERVRILDFGLAKATGDEQLTQVGTALGTVHYMSPEQSQGIEADGRSDLFSLGIVLYEMLTRQLPFKRANIPATMYAIMHDPPPPLAEHWPQAPESLQAIMSRALAKDANERYQTVSDFAVDLRVVLEGRPVLPVEATVTVPAAVAKPKSLAVLHLRNLGSEADDFLCYGITEDLIVDLSRVGNIRVAPMRSIMKYKDSDDDPAEIAGKLNVEMILDGSIMKSPAGIRVSAQLIDARNGDMLWAERWEESPDNLPHVKKALADGISQTLELGTTVVRKADVGVPEAENAQAYELYLKAKYTFERKQNLAEVDIALGMYRQALLKEPSLLAARAGVAEILIHQGLFDQAEGEVRSALAEAESQKSLTEQTHLLRLKARLHARQSQWPEAAESANRALDLARNLGDLDGEAEAIGALISILQPQSRFDEALLLFDRALEIGRKLDDQDKIAESLKNMGVAYSRKGDYSRALELYEEALEIARSADNLSLQAACYSNIGNLHFFQGDLQQAFTFYGRALEIDSRLGDRAGAARQNLNMGLVQLQRGRQREGLDLLQASANLFEALGDRTNLALTLANISQVRLQLGEAESSIGVAERALVIAQEIGHPLAASSAHHRLGAAYLFVDDIENASNHMHVALVIARENNLTRNVAALETELTRLHYYKHEFEAAGNHAKRAQATAREIGDQPSVCLSGAYLAALSTRTGLFHAGIRQLEQYHKKASTIGDAELEAQIELLLGEVLLTHGGDEDKQNGRERLQKILVEAREGQNALMVKQAESLLAEA